MENTHCIICSRKDASPFITLNDRLNKSSKKFYLFQCTCGFIYLNPRPSSREINHYYQSEAYDPFRDSSNGIWNKVYQHVQKLSLSWKYKIIRRYIQGGRILDIGGGKGKFAKYIHEKEGWDVTLQDSFFDFEKRESSISFVKALSDLNRSTKFDVITLWHSLEHIHNIKYLFESLHNLLEDSGLLMIAVPNMNAPERSFYKHNWAPYDAPRHLYHFNLDRLNALCRKNGYDIIQKYSLFQDMPYNVLLSMPSYSPLQLIKATFVICYSFLYTLCAGPEFSSSLLIVCRKSS